MQIMHRIQPKLLYSFGHVNSALDPFGVGKSSVGVSVWVCSLVLGGR